jgi:hypothetical protein
VKRLTRLLGLFGVGLNSFFGLLTTGSRTGLGIP